MEASKLHYPLLQVSLNGSPVAGRPVSFSLTTDAAYPSVLANLHYPPQVQDGAAGDSIVVSLVDGRSEHIYFTGTVYDTELRGDRRVLHLTDGYKKLCDTQVVPSYRRETAAAILQDTLEAAGITEAAITCPAVELARFATAAIPADRCIVLLIGALEKHGYTGLRFFFDSANIFRFGTLEDSGVNSGPVFVLESGDTITRRGHGWVEILPLPIRHSQKVSVNGTTLTVIRTDLTVSKSRSRLRVWVAA
jgi:hypothetical protein